MKKKLFSQNEGLTKDEKNLLTFFEATQTGLPKYAHRCRWCYSLIYHWGKQSYTIKKGDKEWFEKPRKNLVWCCEDCKNEEKDWIFLQKKTAKEKMHNRYYKLTPEERKIFNRAKTLKRNPNAKQRTRYIRSKVVDK